MEVAVGKLSSSPPRPQLLPAPGFSYGLLAASPSAPALPLGIGSQVQLPLSQRSLPAPSVMQAPELLLAMQTPELPLAMQAPQVGSLPISVLLPSSPLPCKLLGRVPFPSPCSFRAPLGHASSRALLGHATSSGGSRSHLRAPPELPSAMQAPELPSAMQVPQAGPVHLRAPPKVPSAMQAPRRGSRSHLHAPLELPSTLGLGPAPLGLAPLGL